MRRWTELGDTLAAARNEAILRGLRGLITLAGHGFRRDMGRRIAGYVRDQGRLRRAYGIDGATPILRYGDEVRRSVEAFAARHPDARFAATSGSTSAPKRIAFTRARLRSIKLGSLSVAARMLVAYGVRRPSLFILASLARDGDGSLTALLLESGRGPSYLDGLLVPSKVLAHEAVAPLLREYGPTAVRLFFLVVSNPGLLYSTNPSTLAVFLAELDERRDESTRLARDFARDPEGTAGGRALRRLVRRVASAGFRDRLRLVAGTGPDPNATKNSSAPGPAIGRAAAGEADCLARTRERGRVSPKHIPNTRKKINPAVARVSESTGRPAAPPMEAYVPGLEGICCWDGGYVRPFLEQVAAYLPPQRFRFVPMYSMSTETVETLNHFERGGEVRFLPIAERVLYEFVPEGAADVPACLVAPWDLEPGRAYAMVVSDPYGLKRYQTEDLFFCGGKVGPVPDLRFLRRRGLAYSFTGEKLTGEQLEEAFARLRSEVPRLGEAGLLLSLFPSRPPGERLPRYRLVVAHPGAAPPVALDAADLGSRLDRILAAANRELEGKLASGRLAGTDACIVRYAELAARLGADGSKAGSGRAWESQFKLLPLYTKLWEEVWTGRPT